jgi:replicative DNA helicase
MRSTRQFDSLRHELKLIYEELRNLAMELRIPIWTASQANRDSANSDIVGLENMSEAYGKAMVADFVVSLSRKPSEKAVGTGRLFIAKNRAGKDGILFPIHIDTSRSQVKVFDTESITLAQAHQDDKEEAKELIRRKWKEINNI